jgi:hypothetical protein
MHRPSTAAALALLALCGLACAAAVAAPEPVPVVCTGNVRITVLTGGVARLEYSPSGQFEDRSSFAFPRPYSVAAPLLQITNTSAWCNISVPASDMQIAWAKQPLPPPPPPQAPSSNGICDNPAAANAICKGPCVRSAAYPDGYRALSLEACCSLCGSTADCAVWVFDTQPVANLSAPNCWLLQAGTVERTEPAKDRMTGGMPGPTSNPFVGHLSATGRINASSSERWVWNAGDVPTGNLLGTLAPTPSTDLAGCCNNSEGWDPKFPLETGLVSRDGWAILDDISVLTDATGWVIAVELSPHTRTNSNSHNAFPSWIIPAPSGREAGSFDYYLFGCGRNYSACLSDFVTLSGPIALPPLPSLGIWWSRHW